MDAKNLERAKILKASREKLGLSLQTVSDKLKKYKCSVSAATLQRYESGEISRIPANRINALSEIYRTTPAYLMGWEEKTPAKSNATINNLEFIEIPKFGKASAGNGHLNLEVEIGKFLIPGNLFKKNLFAIDVIGDSMTGIDKSIPDGAVAVIDPDLCCTDPDNLNNKVCLFEYNDEIYIKQLVIDSQNIVRLRSFNPKYEDIIILDPMNLTCKGRVIKTFIENNW